MTRLDRKPFSAEASPLALPRGTRLAEFDVLGVIGEGGFGIVYQAYDTLLHRQVAIKEFMPAALAMRAGRPEVTVRSSKHQQVFEAALHGFVNEARLLAQFDHESLVKVYRFWRANGTAYMVMPYYEGATLWDALSAKKSPPDEAWLRRLLQPLMEALCVLHQAKCYHRDVSPDNILLLKGSERPVLLDFGAARRIIGNMTHAPTVIFKTGYAPVEQYGIEHAMTQGPWTDIYALAAVVYFAITGDPPPPSVARVMKDSYVPLEKKTTARYSPRFLHAIDHALAVRPKDRPQTIARFATELGVHIEADDGRAPGSAPDAFDGSGAARRNHDRRLLVAAALLAVGSIAGAAGLWLLGPFATRSGPPAAPEVTLNHRSPASSELPPRQPQPESPPGSLKADSGASGTPPVVSRNPAAMLPPYSPGAEMARVVALANPSFRVAAQSPHASARIGIDKLGFTVTSDRSGFTYVFMADPNGQYTMLFPNKLDGNNRIATGQTLALPRSRWEMVAGAPPGPNVFLVIVSTVPRDFGDAGLRQHSPFANIPGDAQREAATRRTATNSPFAGSPRCAPGADCPDIFGAAMFTIDVVN